MNDDRLEVNIGAEADIKHQDDQAEPNRVIMKQPKKRFMGRKSAEAAAAAAGSGSPSIEESESIQGIYHPDGPRYDETETNVS